MPQENQVLRCFSCETFQVHIVKKAKKWECKMCGAKQSFKRHYGKGTESDIPTLTEEETLKEIPQESEPNLEQEPVEKSVPAERKVTSKWEQYLDEDSNEVEDMLFKEEKRRKISDEFTAVLQHCKESYQLPVVGSDDVIKSKGSEYLQSEDDRGEKKKSKNIFDSGLDNDDFLNFI